MEENTLLEVKDLRVVYKTDEATVHAVNGIDLSLERGETLGIVGESGSGKSQLAFSIMGLLAKNGRATGSITFDGQEILNAPLKSLNGIRAEHIAMIFQDPMTSLNPYMRVSEQMAEVLGLTTVAIPNYERGYLAAQYLIANIRGAQSFEPFKIQARVVWRNTVLLNAGGEREKSIGGN